MNREIDEEEFEALLTYLQEINTILHQKKRKMRIEQVVEKYGISRKVVDDIRDINPNLLDEEHLKDIVHLLNTENKRAVGTEYGIGASLINYINQRLNIGVKQNEYYAKLYEQVQDIWIRVGRGEIIEDISKSSGLDIEKVEGLLHPYHELIKRLQIGYKAGDTRPRLSASKKRYNFGPEVLEYIKNGDPVIDANINKELMYYKRRMGICIGDDIEGGSGIEL